MKKNKCLVVQDEFWKVHEREFICVCVCVCVCVCRGIFIFHCQSIGKQNSNGVGRSELEDI